MTPQHLVQEVSTLFTLPDVAIRLNELMAAANATTQDLAEVVELDPGLAATLLKLANSAYYGLVGQVDTIHRAVARVGERALQAMVMATSVVATFKGLPADLVDMDSFWDNSVTCGVIARILARRCGMGQGEQLFLAGLLHGVGKLVFYARRPTEYGALLVALAQRDDRSLAAAEARVFGFDYAALGAELLKSWNLPVMLQVLVACQLRPGEAADLDRQAALLQVANELAASVAPPVKGAVTDQAGASGSDTLAWTSLGLSESLLAEVLAEANLQALEILEIINPRGMMIY